MSQSNLLARKNFSEYIDNHQWFKRHRLTPILASELEKKIFQKMSESNLSARKIFFLRMPMILSRQFYMDPESFGP